MRRFEHKGILCVSRWPLWSAVRKFFSTDKRSGGVLKEKRKEDKRAGRRAGNQAKAKRRVIVVNERNEPLGVMYVQNQP